MKIKLSKIMAAVTALGVTFAGFSAMAASVVTTTTYDYANENVAGATVSVKTTVSGVAVGDEITYYVSNSDSSVVSENEGILYIDQKTAESTSVTFEFSGVKQNQLYDINTTAKNGADIEDWSVRTFNFYPGANYISEGNADVEYSQAAGAVFNDGTDAGWSFTGKVVGNPVEYGLEINGIKYQALACDEEGNFTIAIITSDDLSAATVAKYVVTK